MINNKNRQITVDGKTYDRLPLKTCLIEKHHDIIEIIHEYTKEHVQKGDTVFISEKAVAITQGRGCPIDEVKPRKLATFLSKHVQKTPAGIGLGIPETMEMALREVGILRILLAAGCSAITKPFGIKGVFYIVAGRRAASIDGPTEGTIPPYDTYVVLGPKNPNKVAKEISQKIGAKVAIVDINDIGGVILGISHKSMNKELLAKIFADNPLGQSTEQTPIGILRNF